MFAASVLICAVMDGQILMDRCFVINDNYGPFRTEENCQIRIDQMEKEIRENAEFNSFIFDQLGRASQAASQGICKQVVGDEVEV